ncbi:hypothetical protein LMB22_09580, partial [Limosilactobacillus reuteri]|nr:hypothetical protein [Limosilactobacillus reuteri]
FGSLNMIPDVTPNGVFYLPPTGWLTSFYNPPRKKYLKILLFFKNLLYRLLFEFIFSEFNVL